MSNCRSRLISLAVGAAFVLPCVAQVPEGSALVGTYYLNAGTPGLYVVDLQTAAVAPITGLPASLRTPVQFQGAWSVARRSSDGAVIVGEISSSTVNVHVMHLNGLDITAMDTLYVGSPATSSGSARVWGLPDGQIYVAAFEQVTGLPLANGPLAATGHGIIDTSMSPPTLSPLPPVSSFPLSGVLTGGLVVDPSGSRVYQLFHAPFVAPATGATLLSFEFSTLTWCTVANWPNEAAQGIVIDDDGTLHVSATLFGPAQNHVVHSLRPDGCSPGPITTVASSAAQNTNAFAMDRRTGDFLIGSVNGGVVVGDTLSFLDSQSGQVALVTGGPGWGRIGAGGVAVNNLIESYGAPSDGQNRYTFENFPNPSGQPTVGNLGFSLHLSASPNAPLATVLGLSLGRGSLNALGIDVLLDLNSLVAVSVPAGISASYGLPIPANANLVGTEVTAQSLHLEGGGNFAASRGLSFKIAAMPAPTINSVSPPVAVPGATVTVQGEDFWSGLQLQINGTAVPIVSQSAQTLTFVMPTGVGCDAVLSMTSLGGVATQAINATPVIGASPATALAAGGSLLVISGSNLLGATATVAGNAITVLAQTQSTIVGYGPAGPIGPTTLVVSNSNGCQASAPITLL